MFHKHLLLLFFSLTIVPSCHNLFNHRIDTIAMSLLINFLFISMKLCINYVVVISFKGSNIQFDYTLSLINPAERFRQNIPGAQRLDNNTVHILVPTPIPVTIIRLLFKFLTEPTRTSSIQIPMCEITMQGIS
jgi:hypothetical protein